jgi:hypothetical protein
MPKAAPEPQWAFQRAVELFRKDAWFDELGPELRRARQELDELTRLAVKRAARRESWQAIGDGLGVSRQAARKRYG